MRYLEKTDRNDAQMIAEFARAKGVVPSPPSNKKQQELSSLNARQRQVIGDIVVQKQRLHTARGELARRGLLAVLALLKSESKVIATACAELTHFGPQLMRNYAA